MASNPHISNSVYVWYVRREDGGESPLPVDVSQFLEDEFSKGTQRIDLKDVPDSAKSRHPHLTEYLVDTTTFQQVHKETGHKLFLKRKRLPILEAEACEGEWQWELGYGQFVLYDIPAMLELERGYHARLSQVDLSRTSANIPYTIQFAPSSDGYMTQISNHYRTRRKVQRLPMKMPLQYYLKVPYFGGQPAVMSVPPAGQPGVMPIPSSTQISSATYSNSLVPSIPSGGGFSSNTIGITNSGVQKTSMASHPKGPHLTGSHSMGYRPTGSHSIGYRPTGSHSMGYHPTGPHPMAKSKSPAKRHPSNKVPHPTPSVIDLSDSDDDGSNKKTACEVPLTADMLKYVIRVQSLKSDQDEPCPVCLCKLSEDSDYTDPSISGLDVVRMIKCAHMLHRTCFDQYLKSSRNADVGLRCPTCKKIHGIKMGDMPLECGRMTHTKQPYPLPGHPGCGTIEITYSFTSGRDQEGQTFNAYSFPRRCYLPDSPKGNKVLKLLQVAWKRRLTFTIGTSVTTGATNAIVWNEIHHKTENHSNVSGHGYPDPHYLDNVLMELEAQGVTEDSID